MNIAIKANSINWPIASPKVSGSCCAVWLSRFKVISVSSSGITPAIELVAIRLTMAAVMWCFILFSNFRSKKNLPDDLRPGVGHRREVCEASDRKDHSLLDGFAYRQSQYDWLVCMYDVGDVIIFDQLCRFCGASLYTFLFVRGVVLPLL